MYSNKFLKAFDYMLKYEGGYVNDKANPGGETKFGISRRSYPRLNINDLTLEQAREIYRRDFWVKAKCEDISDENLALKFFDLVVNMGTQVVADGVIGPITLVAINKADPTDLLAALKSEAAGYYRLIAQTNPSQQRFIEGWLSRAYDNV